MKENDKLILEDIQTLETKYNWLDIVDMIEMSYVLANKEEMNEYSEVTENANDGIVTYGAFVKYCYDKYSKTEAESIYSFLNFELETLIKEFKEKYFEKVGK